MARTQSSTAPKLAKVSGETCQIAFGTAGGTGTTTTVTIPSLATVVSVVCQSHSGTTSIYCGTDTANANGCATFIATHGSGEYFDWIAVGKAKM